MKKIISFFPEMLMFNVTYEKNNQVLQKKILVDISVKNTKIYFKDGEYDGEMEDILTFYLEKMGLVKPTNFSMNEGFFPAGLPNQLWRQ